MPDVLDCLFSLLERGGLAPIPDTLKGIFDPSGGVIPFARTPFPSLTSLCCQALGGDLVQATEVTLTWEILYLAAYLLDQVTDEGGPEHPRNLLVILAAACIPAARVFLTTQPGLEIETRQLFLADFDRAILNACAGQLGDLSVAEPSLEQCWEISRKKTGEIYALAARSGARLATLDPAIIEMLNEFGLQLGRLVQIGDDINGLWSRNGNRSDLACGKWTLPVAYAMAVLQPPEREQLRERLSSAGQDQRAEADARREIIESGALLYLATETERCRLRAEMVLAQAIPQEENRTELLALLGQATGWLSHEA